MLEKLYSIKLSLSSMRISIRINDCPIYESSEIFPLNYDIAVNQWLRKGQNEISISCSSGADEPF